MMAKPIFLHIGMPKTGTTSIQQYLHDNRPLLRRHGCVVPLSPGGKNHRNITRYALTDDCYTTIRRTKGLNSIESVNRFRKSFLTKLAAESLGWKADERVVLTGEHMVTLSREDEFARLKELLGVIGNRPVQVVVYLRRQDELYLSLYSQWIKNGGSSEWSELREEINSAAIGNEFDVALFDYDKVLERWTGAFGKDSVRVRIFERQQLVRGDAVADFLAAVDCDHLSATATPMRTNPSLDARSLEYLRRMNILVPRSDRTADVRSKAALIAALERFSDGAKLRFGRSVAKTLLDRYREGNARIAARYLGRPDGSLFREELKDIPEQPPRLSVDEAIELSAKLLAIARTNAAHL